MLLEGESLHIRGALNSIRCEIAACLSSNCIPFVPVAIALCLTLLIECQSHLLWSINPNSIQAVWHADSLRGESYVKTIGGQGKAINLLVTIYPLTGCGL